MTPFTDRLKELRKRNGVTQKTISEFLGITEQAYQKYEYGMREPNHETTIKLADYYQVSVDYLLGRKNYWKDPVGSIKTKNPLDDYNLCPDALKKEYGQEQQMIFKADA